MPKYCYLKINALGDVPMEFVNLADSVPKDEVWDELKKTMSHYKEDGEPIYFSKSKYAFWCSDGKRYNIEVLFDDDGLNKGLTPNHRYNAMVNLGRFTSKKFDYIGKSRNQDIKDMWGANFGVGDMILKIVEGKPIPDCAIFGDNPLTSIMRTPRPNKRMITKYGAEKALNKMSAVMRQVMPDGIVSRDAFENASWERREYPLIKGNEDQSDIDMIIGWMKEVDCVDGLLDLLN
tara:strand:+ start:274 stop:975 length:702 start_codon:yes stop_codon:yes gene_type:complete